ncbi:hypothetical protein [Streptomyces violaceusniger]|uniref:hypothetical protein n=1 Tax=Streptomyces violaceusniger TaxID=68280 RepID=UPI0031D0FA03
MPTTNPNSSPRVLALDDKVTWGIDLVDGGAVLASDQRTRGCSREMADAIVGDPAVVVDVIGRLESGGTETPNGRAVS